MGEVIHPRFNRKPGKSYRKDKRVLVAVISQDQFDALMELAEATGKTKHAVFQDALAHYIRVGKRLKPRT